MAPGDPVDDLGGIGLALGAVRQWTVTATPALRSTSRPGSSRSISSAAAATASR